MLIKFEYGPLPKEVCGMSTSRKKGIRCRETHPDQHGPCDLLLMEEQDGVVGIQDRYGHFTPISVLLSEAGARGWNPDTNNDERKQSVTTEAQTHRYADPGQIDALNKALYTLSLLGRHFGPSTANTKVQCSGGLVGKKLYLIEKRNEVEKLSDDPIYIRVIDLTLLNEEESEVGTLFLVTLTSLEEVESGWIERKNRTLYEHEAEELIAAIKAIRAGTAPPPGEFLPIRMGA